MNSGSSYFMRVLGAKVPARGKHPLMFALTIAADDANGSSDDDDTYQKNYAGAWAMKTTGTFVVLAGRRSKSSDSVVWAVIGGPHR